MTRTAQQEAIRYMAAAKNASPLALAAQRLIEQMPGTADDFIVVMSALYQALATTRGVDYSEVMEKVQEADDLIESAEILNQHLQAAA